MYNLYTVVGIIIIFFHHLMAILSTLLCAANDIGIVFIKGILHKNSF